MRRVHIANPYNSFAMRRHAAPLRHMRGVEITESEEPDNDADLNIHMPWHTLIDYEPEGNSKHLMSFTHANPNSDPAIYSCGMKADAITCLSYGAREKLVGLGLDPRKIRVAPCGTDQIGFRRRRVGIVASKQPNGRKRMHILLDLVWNLPRPWLNLIEFIIVGKGWEDIGEEITNAGGNVRIIGMIENDEDMMALYHHFDVLLSTGYSEGGPLPVIEAMAGGVPVLTPSYGYAHDYVKDKDIYSSAEELQEKLLAMFEPIVDDARVANMLTWYDYAQEYALIVSDLLGVPVKLHDDDGTPRYHGLLKLISEIKPRNILEVGTWSGRRAQQMIQRAAGHRPIETIYYAGFDLFEEMSESMLRTEFSKIPPPERIVKRFLDPTQCNYALHKGKSALALPKAFKNADYRKFDLIFIDGGHRTDTIRLDWENVQNLIGDDTVIVFDDYYINRPDEMEGYGCNEIIGGLGDEWEARGLDWPTTHDKEFGTLEIGMVAVRRA